MKHWVGFLFIGSLILAFFSPLFLMQWLVEPPVVNQPELRLIRYSFTLSNNSNELIENATFTTFAPVSETPFQRVEKIQANERFELVSDGNGNQKLSFEISELPPYGQKVISISADLSVWPRDSGGSVLKGGTSSLVGAKQTSASLAFDAVQAASNTNNGQAWMRAANSWVHENLQDIGYVSESITWKTTFPGRTYGRLPATTLVLTIPVRMPSIATDVHPLPEWRAGTSNWLHGMKPLLAKVVI